MREIREYNFTSMDELNKFVIDKHLKENDIVSICRWMGGIALFYYR